MSEPRGNNMSSGSSIDRSSSRPVKSYLERYHDIKNMLHTDRQNGTFGSTDPVSSTVRSSSTERSSRVRGADPISLTQMDDESSKTLERWESRKERKKAEDPSYANRLELNNDRRETPAPSRGSRWTPKTNYGIQYDSPVNVVRKQPPDSPRESPLFNDVELSPREGPMNVNPLGIHSHEKKSSYVEGLESFSNAISSSVARDVARDYWSRPGVRFAQEPQEHPQQEHEAEEEEYKPDPMELYYDDARDPEGEERYIGRRIRMSNCCRRLSCKSTPDEEELKDPNEFAPTWSSPKKTWHIYAAVLLCVGCVIATAFTVKYVSSGKNATYAMRMTLRPTISVMPSTSPSNKPSSVPSDVPTERPTSERERLISEYLAEITEGVSNVGGSPQSDARVWILYNDKLKLTLPRYASDELKRVAKERIKQRYALACLYYSMGIGEGGVLKGWLEGDECRFVGDYDQAWDGVDCDEEGEVRALAIDGANLSGSIPGQLSLLPKVQNIIIKNNPNLQGKIPSSIGDMAELKQIALYNNGLTGTLPTSILQLAELVYLNVADNTLMGEINWDGIAFQRKLARLILQNNFFEGSISFGTFVGSKLTLLGLSNNNFRGYLDSSIGGMTELEYLYLDRNKLAGQLPDSLGNLTNLVSLNLNENEFYGPLPSTIGQLSKLIYLSAKGNKLSGGLPSDTRSLSSLQTLNLANNALSGNIRSLIAMPSLEFVHLYQNSFTGDIPASLFAAQNLKVLFLSSNSLSGSIPAEVSSARKLKGLYLSDNMLQGNIPNTACSLVNLEDLFIDANAFSGKLPGCFGNLSKLKRLYAFKNQLTGNVPSSILDLPSLVELGLEENNISGGIDEVCTADFGDSLNIWADCDELQGGCDCCTKCCSDSNSSSCD